MTIRKAIFFYLILSTTLVFGRRHSDWSGYYLAQLYTGYNDTLYYGFDYPYKKENKNEFPLMVWLSNNDPEKSDSLSMTWIKFLNKNDYVTINPYFKSSEQWSIEPDTTLRAIELEGLAKIFIDRDDIIDTSITVCGYNQSGIMALTIRKLFPNTFRKAVIFIDKKELLKKCIAYPNVTYVIPKRFKQIIRKQKLRCILVNKISESEIIKISNRYKLFHHKMG